MIVIILIEFFMKTHKYLHQMLRKISHFYSIILRKKIIIMVTIANNVNIRLSQKRRYRRIIQHRRQTTMNWVMSSSPQITNDPFAKQLFNGSSFY